MARHGIVYEDVVSAINALKGQGKSPTIENIRRHLGTGSAGTINQHLRRWKEVSSGTQKIASKENLPEPLISLMKGLWENVLEQATQQFAPIDSNYQKEIANLKSELEKYHNNNKRWQKLFNAWHQEKAAIANEKLTLEQALDFAHKENESLHHQHDGLIKQLQEKQNRVEELNRLHQQTQANLEHYRESTREQRTLDQQQFEREKQQYLFEIKNLKEELILQKTKYSDLNQQYHVITHANSELEKQHQKYLQSMSTLTDKVEQLTKETIECQQTTKHFQQQLKETEMKIDKKYAEIISLQSDNNSLTQQLVDLKQSLLDTQSQTKLLSSQNYELMQEKLKLQEQLNHLQSMITA